MKYAIVEGITEDNKVYVNANISINSEEDIRKRRILGLDGKFDRIELDNAIELAHSTGDELCIITRHWGVAARLSDVVSSKLKEHINNGRNVWWYMLTYDEIREMDFNRFNDSAIERIEYAKRNKPLEYISETRATNLLIRENEHEKIGYRVIKAENLHIVGEVLKRDGASIVVHEYKTKRIRLTDEECAELARKCYDELGVVIILSYNFPTLGRIKVLAPKRVNNSIIKRYLSKEIKEVVRDV